MQDKIPCIGFGRDGCILIWVLWILVGSHVIEAWSSYLPRIACNVP